MSSLVEHLDALLLALASSVDNFAVGVSVGIARKRLPFWANAIISFCNAGGALIAGIGGSALIHRLPFQATWLAAIAFGTLGIQEFFSFAQQQGSNTKKETFAVDSKNVLSLAIPMTLNNLAGGVAGGAAGLSPFITAFYGLLASYLTMTIGHHLGYRLGRSRIPFNPSLVSGSLLTVLCLFSILELM